MIVILVRGKFVFAAGKWPFDQYLYMYQCIHAHDEGGKGTSQKNEYDAIKEETALSRGGVKISSSMQCWAN
jgi:hypothetical protein